MFSGRLFFQFETSDCAFNTASPSAGPSMQLQSGKRRPPLHSQPHRNADAKTPKQNTMPHALCQLGQHSSAARITGKSMMKLGTVLCVSNLVKRLNSPKHANKWVCSKLNRRGYTGFGLCFHLPGFHFGTSFLSHSQMTFCDSVFVSQVVDQYVDSSTSSQCLEFDSGDSDSDNSDDSDARCSASGWISSRPSCS